MHIYEKPLASDAVLTKCTNMTEEGHRRHGLNGTTEGNSKEDSPKSNYGQGGRLKFFKDGKFILELERAREGERISWVSVPRKTFWPPQGTAYPTPPSYRQESSTSLSISDDNSSVQSSPWQRDHSWKQTNPSRGISKELSLFYFCPKSRRSKRVSKKRRRPYSIEADTFIERTVKVKREKRTLLVVVQALNDRNVVRTNTPPRCEMVVSPRKRFLREMEKDNKTQAEDSNVQKRSRCKSQGSMLVKVDSPVSNGVSTPEETTSVKTSKSCSYSITSLLADDRCTRRSPSNSPCQYMGPQAPPTQPHYCSPSAEERWYSESVDRLKSIELSQVENCGYAPYAPPAYLGGPYVYPFHPMGPPHYYGRGAYVVPSQAYRAPVLPLPVKREAPSCSWGRRPPKEPVEECIEENGANDMPLNLSKHSA